MGALVLRQGELRDREQLLALRQSLWPDSNADEHTRELTQLLTGNAPGSLPSAVLVAQEVDSRIVGFLEVGLRSHADGCDPSCPVGYVEGWFVIPSCRGQGVGARLMAEAEEWARSRGCREMASDTWLASLDSQRAHEALEFEEVDRCVHYRKLL